MNISSHESGSADAITGLPWRLASRTLHTLYLHLRWMVCQSRVAYNWLGSCTTLGARGYLVYKAFLRQFACWNRIVRDSLPCFLNLGICLCGMCLDWRRSNLLGRGSSKTLESLGSTASTKPLPCGCPVGISMPVVKVQLTMPMRPAQPSSSQTLGLKTIGYGVRTSCCAHCNTVVKPTS